LQALKTFQRLFDLQRAIADEVGMSHTLNLLGLISYDLKDYARALDFYRQALQLGESINHPVCIGLSASNLAWTYRQLGKFEWALQCYQRALKAYAQTDNQRVIGQTLTDLGTVYSDLKQYETAYHYCLLGARLLKETCDRTHELSALHYATLACYKLGNYPQAVVLMDEALAIWKTFKDDVDEAALSTEKPSYELSNRPIETLFSHQEPLEICRDMNDLLSEAMSLRDVASIYYRDGLYLSALAYEQQACGIYQLLGQHEEMERSLFKMAKMCEKLGKSEQAMHYYGQILTHLFGSAEQPDCVIA
jgi:tetratricopeptide (TPR) repeat protein